VGPVIGSSWKGIGCIRSKSRPLPTRKVKPERQAQRARFKFETDFVKSIRSLLSLSYSGFKDQLTAPNSALANVMQQAVTGYFPDLRIEYTKVRMVKGSVTTAMLLSARLHAAMRSVVFCNIIEYRKLT